MHPVIHRLGHHAKRHYQERYVKPHGARAHIILTIDGILVAIILGLLGMGAYFAFVYNPLRDTFAMHFENTELVSGGLSEIALTVENRGDTSLKDASVDVFFPSQFRVYGRSMEADHDAVTIDTIPKGASVTYRFRGLLLGPAGEAPIYARMRATDSFGVTDERFIEGKIVWKDNLIKLDWHIPGTVIRGQDIPITLTLKNLSQTTFDAVAIAIALPNDFRIRLSSPAITGDTIAFGELRPGDEAHIEILGSFPKLGDALTTSRFHAGIIWNGTDGETLIAAADTDTAVISLDVRVKASFIDDVRNARPGDRIAFRIDYANDGSYPLDNLKIRLPLDIGIAELEGSEALDGGLAGSALGWESVTLPSLSRIEPGVSGTVSGTILLTKRISKYRIDPMLSLAPEATFSLTEFDVADARFFGEGQQVKVAGRIDVAGVARYFTNEGDQLGRGPLPPRVGATTRYWIILKAENGPTEAKDARMTITLPEYVQWTGKSAVTAGFEVQETEGGQTLIWNIGAIPAHAGEVRAAPNVSLELALTPTTGLIGTSPELISSATLTATDSWTDLEMSSRQSSLTTALPTDPFIEGRTAVQP